MVLSRCIALLLALIPFVGGQATQQTVNTDTYRIVRSYPHDPRAFTQGLLYVDGHLYESTGLNGHSSIRMVDLNSGRVLQKYDLPADQFGEGLTEWGRTLIQLTWQGHKAFVY